MTGSEFFRLQEDRSQEMSLVIGLKSVFTVQ